MPDIALRQSHPANDRAKSMLLASVGVKVVLEPPRRRFGRGWALSRGRLSLTKKPPKTLAQRPPGQNSTQIRMKACGQAMVHFQPAGDRSFASAPLTVAPNARSCATCAKLASWIFSRWTLLTAADLFNVFLPAFWRRSADSLLAWPTWWANSVPPHSEFPPRRSVLNFPRLQTRSVYSNQQRGQPGLCPAPACSATGTLTAAN